TLLVLPDLADQVVEVHRRVPKAGEVRRAQKVVDPVSIEIRADEVSERVARLAREDPRDLFRLDLRALERALDPGVLQQDLLADALVLHRPLLNLSRAALA